MEKKIFQRLRDKLIEHAKQNGPGTGPGGFVSMRDLAEMVQSIIIDIELEEKRAVCNIVGEEFCSPFNPGSDATTCINCGQKIINKDGLWYASIFI